MGERVRDIKNKLLSSSFFRLLFFATASNLLQAISVYYQKNVKNLNDSSLAMINYGLYFVGFYGIIIDSLSKWLMLKSSVIKRDKRINFLNNILGRSRNLVFSLIFILSIIILVFNPPQNFQQTIIVGIMTFRALIFVFIIFPNAYLTTLEAFLVIGVTKLISPIMRMLFTLVITDDSVWVFFLSFIFTEIIVWFLILWGIARKEKKSIILVIKDFYKLDSNGQKIVSKLNSRMILQNMILQVSLVSFYILDGIILERFLSDYDYVVYTTYAFVFKLPLFISINIMSVLLGREVILGDKGSVRKLIKTLLFSVFLIVILYTGVLVVEHVIYLYPLEVVLFGKEFHIKSLLSLIGYTEYLIKELTLPYGLSWLLNTVNSFLYTYLLKTGPDNIVEKVVVILYGLSYLVTLLFFNNSLVTMMWIGSIVGGFFCFIGIIILWKQIRSFRE